MLFLGTKWRGFGGVCRQPDAMWEAATPVKVFQSNGLGWAALLTQPVASCKKEKPKPKHTQPAILSTGTGP